MALLFFDGFEGWGNKPDPIEPADLGTWEGRMSARAKGRRMAEEAEIWLADQDQKTEEEA